MRKALGLAALASLLALGAGTATAGGGYSPLTVAMKAQSGSKLAGSATLTQDGFPNGAPKSLTVAIVYPEVVFIPETMYPAHIHTGTCAKFDPAPAYALAPLNSGKSQTDLKAAVTLKTLLDSPHAIVVHDPVTPSRYLSCGDITAPGPLPTAAANRNGY